jgi:hypothetical protein
MKPVINFAVLTALSFLSLRAVAAEGDHGRGHEMWHAESYSKPMQPGTEASCCCNLADCRPTEIRSAGDYYEVKKDGHSVRVPPEKIIKVAARDGGAHNCAPLITSTTFWPDDVFCIVMPHETKAAKAL